jgi:hypothetical protein
MAINKTAAGTFAVDRDQFKKRHQKTFDTHKEAVAYEKKVLAQIQTREYVAPSSETVKELAERWHQRKVEAGTYKRASLEQWKNHVNRFIAAELGTVKVSELHVETIEQARGMA